MFLLHQKKDKQKPKNGNMLREPSTYINNKINKAIYINKNNITLRRSIKIN